MSLAIEDLVKSHCNEDDCCLVFIAYGYSLLPYRLIAYYRNSPQYTERSMRPLSAWLPPFDPFNDF